MGSVQPPSMQCAAYNKLGVVSCGRGTIDTSRCGMHDKLWEFVLALCNAQLELEEPPSLTSFAQLELEEPPSLTSFAQLELEEPPS